MTWAEAKVIIEEARKQGYRGTDWERGFIANLEFRQPDPLSEKQALSLQEFYRRATGGGRFVRREIIGSKRRYTSGIDQEF